MILFMELEADHRSHLKTAWYVYADGPPSMSEVDEMYTEPTKEPRLFVANLVPARPIEVPNTLSAHMGLKRYYVGDVE